jgi:hypothetical protein
VTFYLDPTLDGRELNAFRFERYARDGWVNWAECAPSPHVEIERRRETGSVLRIRPKSWTVLS